MQITTQGIVLHKTRFSESSIIAQIFTKDTGVQSFIIKNAFSKKNKNILALLENLSMVEVTFDDKKNNIHYLNDINLYYHYTLIPFDIVRKTIFIFYNELIYKLLREYRTDEIIYCFIEEALRELDSEAASLSDIHLRFMVKLSKVMGFYPNDNYMERRRYFSIEESSFTDHYYESPMYLSANAASYLWDIMKEKPYSLPPKSVRQELLDGLIRFFEMHNEQIYKIESVQILSQILND